MKGRQVGYSCAIYLKYSSHFLKIVIIKEQHEKFWVNIVSPFEGHVIVVLFYNIDKMKCSLIVSLIPAGIQISAFGHLPLTFTLDICLFQLMSIWQFKDVQEKVVTYLLFLSKRRSSSLLFQFPKWWSAIPDLSKRDDRYCTFSRFWKSQ